MQAPNLATLFDFDALEPRIVAILETNLSSPAGVSIRKKRDAAQLTLPRVEAELQLGAATGWRHIYRGRDYRAAYAATLTLTVLTARQRDNEPPDTTSHSLLVSQLRLFLQIAAPYFGSNVFPYHSLASIVEKGSRAGHEDGEEGGRDWTELKFDLIVGIRNDAWPDENAEEIPLFGLMTEAGEIILSESGAVLQAETDAG